MAGDGNKAVTIDDVAALAGVHRSTVSRALSRPDLVGTATRHKVHDAAAALGYRPNQVARSLSSGRTGLLALLVPDCANPFFAEFVKATQEQAARRDCAVIVAGTGRRSDTELRLVRSLASNVDGFVVSSAASPVSQLRRSASDRPLVSVGPEGDPGLDFVVSDVDIAALSLDHLWSLGHRHIAVVEGPPGLDSTARRSQAGVAWAERHCGARLELIGGWDGNVRDGFVLADVVADLMPSGVTAAVAYCDAVAFGMLMRFVNRRIRVPGELSLMGVDNVELASFVPGGLTTVDLGAPALAKAAVDAVLGLLPAGHALLPAPTVIVRGTTGPARQLGSAASDGDRAG